MKVWIVVFFDPLEPDTQEIIGVFKDPKTAVGACKDYWYSIQEWEVQ